MLTEYCISGFKTFRRSSSFRFAPITLIYGGNSSGKSTIIQSIMLLKQTLESTSLTPAALIFGSSKYVNLGNFSNVVSDHDPNGRIEIAIGTTRTDFGLRPTSSAFKNAVRNSRFQCVFESDLAETPRVSEIVLSDADGLVARYQPSSRPVAEQDLRRSLQRLRMSRGQSLRAIQAGAFELSDLNAESTLLRLTYENYHERIPRIVAGLHRSLKRRQPHFLFVEEEESELSADARKQTAILQVEHRISELSSYTYSAFLEDLRAFNSTKSVIVNRFLPVMTFNRQLEQRTSGMALDARVISSEASPSYEFPFYDLGLTLVSMANGIESELSSLAYVGPLRDFPERNYIYFGAAEQNVGARGENLPGMLYADERRVHELNDLASLMGLDYTFSVHRSQEPELKNVFAVRLNDVTTGADVGLSDVGFGISQVLPILMQCTASESRIVVMEQPEIHLNPMLQAALGQVFARAIEGTGRQFIVETHSEHLLLRLQRLIRLRRLEPDKVAVLYVSKHREGSSVIEIPLAENGDRLLDWPDGFFDDTYRELFDTAPLR